MLFFCVLFLARLFFNPPIFAIVLIEVIVIVFTILILHFGAKIKLRQALHLFSVFISNETHSTKDPSNYISTSAASMIRVLIKTNSDPSIFVRYMNSQKHLSKSTSVMLEIIRFLSLFPSRRNSMYNELIQLSSNSLFDRFTIYFFGKKLKSLLNGFNDIKQGSIHLLQRSYIIHHSLFWKMRYENRKWSALKEAFSSAYYYIELYYEITSLLERYPFDDNLFIQYHQFLLIACGDYDCSLKSKQIATDLNGNRSAIPDPLLHPMLSYNPRIMQFCNDEELKLGYYSTSNFKQNTSFQSMSNTSQANTSNYGKQNSKQSQVEHSSKNEESSNVSIANKLKDNSNEPPIASFIKVSNRLIPIYPIIHMVIPFLFLILFLFHSKPMEDSVYSKALKASKLINQSVEQYQSSICSLYIGISSNFNGITNYSNYSNFSQCIIEISRILNIFQDFTNLLPAISTSLDFSSEILFDLFQSHFINSTDVCHILRTLETTMINNIITDFNIITTQVNEIDSSVTYIQETVERKYLIYYIILTEFIIALIFIIGYLIILLLQVNKVFSKEDPKVIEFLQSHSRLLLMMFEQVYESWEHLTSFIPIIQNDKSTDWNFDPTQAYLQSSSHLSGAKFSSGFMNSMNNNEESNTSPKQLTRPTNHSNNKSATESTDQSEYSGFDLSEKQQNLVLLSFTGAINQPYDNQHEKGSFHPISLSRSSSHKGSDISSENNVSQDVNHDDEDIQLYGLEEDNVESLIDDTIKKTNKSWIFIPCFIFIHWLLICFCFIIFLIPINLRYVYKLSTISHVKDIKFQMNNVLDLTKASFSTLFYNTSCFDVINNSYSHLVNSSSEVTNLFNTRVCLYLHGLTCLTPAHNAELAMNDQYFNDRNSSIMQYIPFFVHFTISAFKNIYQPYFFRMASEPISCFYCFIICIIFICITIIIYGVNRQKLIMRGFNSLFNFPEEFLAQKKKIETTEEKKSEPQLSSAVLVVTSVENSDEIYSISSNSVTVLGAKPSEFISRKLNKVFPLIHNDNPDVEFREHLMPDKKTRKIFRSYTDHIGQISKTLMIEEQRPNSQRKDEQLTNKLMEFIPPYFAKKFGDENIRSTTFNNSILIIMSLSENLTSAVNDRVTSTINHQIMNYSHSMILLESSGGRMAFTSFSNVQPLVALLFLRDILNDCKALARQNPSMFAPVNFIVTKFDNLTVTVNDKPEPVLEITPNIDELKEAIMHLNNNYIFINDQLLNMFPGIPVHEQKMEFSQQTSEFDSFLFDDFLKFFTNNV